jgi:hypothetical protein
MVRGRFGHITTVRRSRAKLEIYRRTISANLFEATDSPYIHRIPENSNPLHLDHTWLDNGDTVNIFDAEVAEQRPVSKRRRRLRKHPRLAAEAFDLLLDSIEIGRRTALSAGRSRSQSAAGANGHKVVPTAASKEQTESKAL